MTTETLADWLRRRMNARSLSERQVAKEIGVSRGAIERILDGRGVRPKTLDLLAAWAGIPVSDLMRRIGVDPGEGRASPDIIRADALAFALQHPEYGDVVDELMRAPAHKWESVRAHLAYLKALEEGTIPPPPPPDPEPAQ